MSKISLIIPVYNVEDYLKRCLDSVFEQSADVEVIVINDGSTDNSAAIIEAYRHYPHLIVIDQKNAGISVARNVGIDAARGEYVLFLDSDDMLLPNALSELSHYLQDADVVCAQAMMHRLDGTTSLIAHPLKQACSGKQYFRQVLPAGFPVMVWLNAYRRDFLNEHNLRFLPGMVYEDEEFIIRAFLAASTVKPAEVVWLNYILRPGSFTTSYRKRQKGVDLSKIAVDISALSDNYSAELNSGLKKHAVKLYIKAFRHRGVHIDNPYADFTARWSMAKLPMSFSDRLKMGMIVLIPSLYAFIFSLKHDRKVA